MPGPRHLNPAPGKGPMSGPPKPGLVWNPGNSRWVRPRSGAPGQTSPISLKLIEGMSDQELSKLRSTVRVSLAAEKNSLKYNDLSRVLRQTSSEVNRRLVSKALVKAQNLHRRMAADEVLAGVEVLLKGVSIEAVIPLEQIKGDLRRAGHTIKSVMALDPEARRIFFMDENSNPRYCTFNGPEDGFSLQRVGFQAEIAKEYNAVDLEPDSGAEEVETAHDEEDADEEPGMIPGGTPVVKPEMSSSDYDDIGEAGDGLGNRGWGEKKKSLDAELVATMIKLDAMLR